MFTPSGHGPARYIILIYIQSWPIAMTNGSNKRGRNGEEAANKERNKQMKKKLSSNYIFTHSKFLSSSFVS